MDREKPNRKAAARIASCLGLTQTTLRGIPLLDHRVVSLNQRIRTTQESRETGFNETQKRGFNTRRTQIAVEAQELSDSGISTGREQTKVKIDGEEATLHITDQSVMFEKSGKISGFERSAIRMLKPQGDAMIVAYSVGSEVRSVRIEPMTAVSPLLVSERLGPIPTKQNSQYSGTLAGVFGKLYVDAREELEQRLVKVEGEPGNKTLRLTPQEMKKYIDIRNRMTDLLGSMTGLDVHGDESPVTFWGLEKQPLDLQLAVVKIEHVHFLLYLVSEKAETEDVGYSAKQVWPKDWPGILERFNLGNDQYVTDKFSRYVGYLETHWKKQPGTRRPILVGA